MNKSLLSILILFGFVAIGGNMDGPGSFTPSILSKETKNIYPDGDFQESSDELEFIPPHVVNYRDDTNEFRRSALRAGRKSYREKRYISALHYFIRAATLDGGTGEGMYLLGNLYLMKTSKYDLKLGLSYIIAAAKGGYSPAIFDMGLRFYLGEEVERNLGKAKLYWSQLPCNNPKYKYHLGLIILELAAPNDLKERIRGLKLILAAATDNYELAEKVVQNNDFRSRLLVEENKLKAAKQAYEQAKKSYKEATNDEERIMGLQQIIKAADEGNEMAKIDVEIGDMRSELQRLQEAPSQQNLEG